MLRATQTMPAADLRMTGEGRRRLALFFGSLVLGLTLGLAASPDAPVRACSCLPPPPVPEALEEAAVVFRGSVVALRRVPRRRGAAAGLPHRRGHAERGTDLEGGAARGAGGLHQW